MRYIYLALGHMYLGDWMRGVIQFEQGAVIYIILMIAVIIIGVAIATKGQFLLLFQQGEFKGLFEPGVLRVGTDKSQRLSLDNFQIFCRQNNIYEITLTGVTFDYEGGGDKKVDFYIVLDVANNLFVGEDENGNNFFTCTKTDTGFDCPSKAEVKFYVRTDEPADKEFFHFTLWRASPGVTDILDLPDAADTKTLANLIDSQFQHYMGSFDIGGQTFGPACTSATCKQYNNNEGRCIDTPGCWYVSGLFFGLGGECRGCRGVTSCSEYKVPAECSACGGYSGVYTDKLCEWRNNRCEEI